MKTPRLFVRYYSFKPFTFEEAAMLFKLAAIAEAIGWTMLIAGVGISRYITPGNDIAVQFAGRMHGTFFLVYIAAVALLAPSLNWKDKRILIAGLCSVPPYGSIIYDWVFTHQNKIVNFSLQRCLFFYRTMASS